MAVCTVEANCPEFTEFTKADTKNLEFTKIEKLWKLN